MKTLKREPLSREQLLKRGRCCKMGCINCPWDFNKKKGDKKNDK